MDLTLHQLRVVASVARNRSFTGAAHDLMVSQPVLSRTVRDVERVLGVRLFERTTRAVDLTADGHEFAVIAKEILDAYDTGIRRFAAHRAGESGTVTVAALPSIAASLLPPVVSALREDRPDLRFRIFDGTTREVLEHVRTARADVGLTEAAASYPGLDAHHLRDDPLLAILPQRHPLADHDHLTWAELATETFIAFSPDSSIRRLTDLAFSQAGATPATVVQTRAVATAAGMIAAGLGVSAVPELVLPLASFADLAVRPLTAPAVSRKLAAHTRQHPMPPAVSRFLARLRG
jgi:DNA-binding transcriptional LysR family regulator